LVVRRWRLELSSVVALGLSAKQNRGLPLQFIQTQKCSGDAAGALALPDG
jgi:hypothetical protein